MTRNSGFTFIIGLVLSLSVAGCKPKTPGTVVPANGYFHTPFQDESQFIVEAIISDLAEQMFFAAHHRLPETNYFSVTAAEKAGSTVDVPVYELRIRLEPKKSDIKMDLKIDGPIWSPRVYKPVADAVASTIGLGAGTGGGTEDAELLTKLSDSKAETIEQENKSLSAALQEDFSNSELHEKAALLLGAFALREHSGKFFEIRSPLSRITAHLAMAQFLRSSDLFGENGQVAEAMLLTLMNDEAAALETLGNINTNNAASRSMVRALHARNTGDFRPLADVTNLSPMEAIERFAAESSYVSTPTAWAKLNDRQKQIIDYVRIANENDYSVENGHELLQVSMPLEMQEFGGVYQLSHDKELAGSDLAKTLEATPEHCFSTGAAGQLVVNVIGWGQWSMFFQRHLCHAMQQNFYFLNYQWGVGDEAKKFASECDETFGGLMLYPFVRRYNCTDETSYHKSVDDGFKVTVATPQFVPAECWNELCYTVRFAPPYNPNPNPHINEWHNHNPPPGTVYDLHPRLNHPSLISRGDAVARFEQLHEIAPYDCRISGFILDKKYNSKPNYQQALAMFHELTPFSVTALRWVAGSVYDQPKQYEEYMTRAGDLEPSCYYILGDYAWNHNDQDKAARFYERAYDADLDRVRAASYALWLVRYYLKHEQKARAEQVANEAGAVYSFRGLEAEAFFFESTSNYDGAFEWYGKIEERYNGSAPMINFLLRYKEMTGNTGFDGELQKRMSTLFPKGKEKVSIGDFKTSPTDGIVMQGQSSLMESAGLKKGDVIVALSGIRVHNLMQYTYERDSLTGAEMDLIVCQGNTYQEVKASPPNHKFGVEVQDYQVKQ